MATGCGASPLARTQTSDPLHFLSSYDPVFLEGLQEQEKLLKKEEPLFFSWGGVALPFPPRGDHLPAP